MVNYEENDLILHVANNPFNTYNGDEPYVFASYAHIDANLVFPE